MSCTTISPSSTTLVATAAVVVVVVSDTGSSVFTAPLFPSLVRAVLALLASKPQLLSDQRHFVKTWLIFNSTLPPGNAYTPRGAL